jgi:Ca2+-binding RTX toxin-like protein
MATINTITYETTGSYYHELFAWNTGAATVRAGGGFDFINASFESGRNDIIIGGYDRDIIWAQQGDDIIFGDEPLDGEGRLVPYNGDESDSIIAGSGKDWVQAGGGDDYVNGESGEDQIYGGVGNDFLMGGFDADTIYGGIGNDTLAGGYLDESLIPLVYQFTITLNRNGITEDPYTGDITSTFGGTLFIDNAQDVLDGGAGDDTYYVDTSNDVVIDRAGEGNDWVLASVSFALEAGAEIETLSTTANDGTGAINLTGNEFAQEITGNAGSNRLDGRGGADTLIGLGGSDVLIVDHVDDIVIEAFNGGNDRVGASVSYVLAAGQHVEKMSTTASGGIGTIDLTGNELVQEITGNAGNNRLDGRGGADTLIGLGGNDTLIVDNAGDIVIEALDGGTDRVGASVSYTLAAGQHIERMSTTNSAGTNTIHLTGNEFAQEMTGNAGNNWLTGGGGADEMTGLGGNNTFDFNDVSESGTSAGTRDIITDFSDTGGKQDRINVATIDADTLAGGNNAFVLDTNGSFSTGEIRQTQVNGGADLLVEFNNDADAAADMSILLQGRTTLLDAADFVF